MYYGEGFIEVTAISPSTPVRESKRIINLRHVSQIIGTSDIPEARCTLKFENGDMNLFLKESLQEISDKLPRRA